MTRRDVQRSLQRGAALVDTSLILVVFMAILIGILDFGHFLYRHQVIVDRERNAIRYAVVNPYDPTAIQNLVLYGQTDAPPAGTQAWFNLTPSMVTVNRFDAGTASDRVVVTVANYSFPFLSPFISGIVQGQPVTSMLPYEGPNQ